MSATGTKRANSTNDARAGEIHRVSVDTFAMPNAAGSRSLNLSTVLPCFGQTRVR
jgi:hypothetical protein